MNKPTLVLALTLAAWLAACGQKQEPAAEAPVPEASAPAVDAEAPAAEAPAAEAAASETGGGAAVASTDLGKGVFNKTCALCHASGVAGAPIPGHKDDWAPRIAQGMDTLYKHALEGFTGDKGMMPARGGAANLPDDDVKAAVDHMVALSQ
jgi:cytochrome c5